MKLVTYNVGLVNPEAVLVNVGQLTADLLVMDADVVALHKFEPELCQPLDAALRKAYAYRHYLVRKDKGYSCALFSKLELTDVEELHLERDSAD